MKLNKRKLTVVVVTAAVFVLLVTMAWAAPPARESSAPLLATPGLDADKLDGHHAVAASASLIERRWKILWTNAQGQFAWAAMPETALNNRYLRRDDSTLLAVNPFEIEATTEIAANGGLNFMHHWSGYTEIYNSTHTQGTIYIPVHNFTSAFGSPLRLAAIDLCYQVASGSYIYQTAVYYADNTGNRTELLWDDTNRTSTTWTCYSIPNDTPTLIEGPLLVYFNLIFGGTGSGYKVTIGQITLTLTE
ncbi:MAG TPA: hypothetical protein VJ714_13430 [Anaerolineae bacterium]|jgi:hypothetical protein|nr:hypothetical protein [Anaerolineae bacterium]